MCSLLPSRHTATKGEFDSAMCPKCMMFVCLQLLILFHLVVVTDCQSDSASAPECYNTTTCPCCNIETCPSDHSGSCGGKCKDGYHGGKCRNRCPYNCVRCVDAPTGGGVATCVQCTDGYYSTPTKYQCQLPCPPGCRTCVSATQCTSCKDAYYLTSSNQCRLCNETCASCTSATYCITCKRGFYQENGTGKCRQCPYGCIGGLCTNDNGACFQGCKWNFKQDPSGTCDTCINGMSGYQCNINCSANCESTCDRISGVCTTCQPGFHGDFCKRRCPENCASSCNMTTGNCNICKEGFHGNTCSIECRTNCRECSLTHGSCVTCAPGLYGITCDNNCSEHCVIKVCDKNNGSFECVPGYVGHTCDIKVTTSTEPVSPRDGLPLVVTSLPDIYVGEAIGLTLAVAVVIVAVIGGVIVLYRRRKACFGRENLPPLTFKARTDDETKLKAELASIDEEIATLTEQRAKVKAQLQELDRQMPYRHTDRADVMATDNSYEMLQRHQPDDGQGHYTTIKY